MAEPLHKSKFVHLSFMEEKIQIYLVCRKCVWKKSNKGFCWKQKCLRDTNMLDLSVENFTHGKFKAFNFIRGSGLITLISHYPNLDVAGSLFSSSK